MIRPTVELTRNDIIRSIIGLLQGSHSLAFNWIHNKQEFVVRNGISSEKDINEVVLKNYLQFYCKYGTAFKLMFDFCYPINNQTEDHILCYTLNAYRSCLRSLLTNYINKLNTISDYLINNNNNDNKIISLIGLKYYLDCDQNNNLLLTIEILWQIFERIRETALNQTTNSSLSFAILNAIYQRIDFEKTAIKNIIYTLFVYSVKPTLDYFDTLLSDGLIHDPHQEFVFIESNDQNFHSISFWNNCIQLRNDFQEMPLFLAKHLDIILIAAKSRLMTQRIEKFGKENNKIKRKNLFNQFLSVLNNILKHNNSFEQQMDLMNENDCQIQNQSNDVIIPKSLEMSSSDKTLYDCSLNYFDVYAMHNPFYYNYLNISFDLKDSNDFYEYCLPQKTIKTIDLILNEALTETITEICRSISSNLIDLIINEYKKYLTNFCDYYLMRSSGLLLTYCYELFHNIHAINSSEIDNIFIFENQPTFYSMPDIKPFISFNKLSAEPIEFLNNVNLIYNNISWPFNILFNLEVIGLFNKVFQLLLKVKYSKWVLDQLLFSQQFKSRETMNKLENLTRFKLQNCVNKLYNHLMFAIDSHIKEALNDCLQINHFDQLLEKHNKFIAQLKQTIFYRQETLRNLVKKLIKLSSDLDKVWRTRNNCDNSRLISFNIDIDRCIHLFDCYYDVINKTQLQVD
jgi:hypothetical protein